MVGRQTTRRGRIRAASPALLVALLLVLLHGSAPVAHAAPPSNDDRTGATPIALLEGPTFDLTEATAVVGDPVSCPSGGAPQGSVWFAYTAIDTGPVVVALFHGAGNASLHVMAADGTTELGCAITADPTHLEPHVDLDAVAGETYLIAVIGETTPGATGYVAIEPPLVVSLDTVTTAHVNADGSVTALYVFTCSQDMQIEPELDLDQGSGSTRAMGSSLTTVTCAAPTTTFEILVEPGHGPNPEAVFRNGPADAYIQFNAFTGAQVYRSAAETGTIQLTGGPAVTAPPTDTSVAVDIPAAQDDGAPLVLGLLILAAGSLALAATRPVLRRPRSRRA